MYCSTIYGTTLGSSTKDKDRLKIKQYLIGKRITGTDKQLTYQVVNDGKVLYQVIKRFIYKKIRGAHLS